MPSSEDSRAFLAGKWLLAAVVPASAMAIGSLHTPVLVAVAAAAAIACALVWTATPRRTSRASQWVLVAFGILLGATVLQAIPLPAGVARWIAPGTADVWARALSPLHEAGPAWHPVTVAPPATHVEILRGALYGCVFLAALRVAYSEGGASFLERVVVASAVVMALASLAHASVRAQRVFGIYRPRDAYAYYADRLSPLLNPNHLAAYLNVGAFVAAGVAARRREGNGAFPRVLALAAVLLLAGTSVWAGSRGAMGSLVIGALLLGALSLYRRGRMGLRGAEAGLVVVALVAAGALYGLGASDVARAEASDTDTSKLGLALSTLRLVETSPFAGVGRGAFETIFPSVREGTTYFTFLRTENIVTQWVVEWGAPASLLGAAALAMAFRPNVVLHAARPAVGAWAALVATVVHELVDFHLEVPGIVVLVTVVAAIVAGSRAASGERRERLPSARRLRAVAWTTAAATAVAIVVVLPSSGHALPDERDAAAKSAIDPSVPPSVFRDQIRSMMLRYPAEPYFPLAGAIRAQARGEGSVVPWTAHALERYPRFGRAHLVLARSLAPRNRAQARLEYRLAYENDVGVRENVLKEVSRLVGGFDDAMELVPVGEAGTSMLDHLAETLSPRLPATSAGLDAELQRRSPETPGLLRRRVAAALSDVTHHHPWCEGRRCEADAIAAAKAIVTREPDKCSAHASLARVRIAVGEPKTGLDELAVASDRCGDRAECLKSLVELALEVGDRRRADDTIDRVQRSGCGSPDACVALYTWLAGTLELRGSRVRAAGLYKRAYELAPDKEYLLEHYAQMAEQSGLLTEAIDAYGKLADRHPEESRWAAARDGLKAKQHERAAAFPK